MYRTNLRYPYRDPEQGYIPIRDYGLKPLVIDLEEAVEQNRTFRTALWTGNHFQVTLMNINVGEDIGLEVHPETDQFIRIEEGQGLVQMGNSREDLNFQAMAREGYAVIIPAGKWHNITNTGNKPLKVYVIYAPPEHPFGTVHETKAAAMAAERHN
ncbi:cupin domain-containing protein [Paenibacillus sanfengchensis]|uniref:cupin domain-containing protein n=1 Tax=Paenibacillus sanfengchensis TaxID=3119819 RepID=UPI002FE17B9A